MRQMAAATPDARYRKIADAAHLPALEQPARFNVEVSAFLDELAMTGRAA